MIIKNKVSELLFNSDISLTVEDKLNMINDGAITSNMFGFTLDKILDISNYYKIDDDIKNILKSVLPEGYEDMETGYLNMFIDYTHIIGMNNEDFSNIYLEFMNMISIKINQIIYTYKQFDNINKILKYFINISEESNKVCNEIHDILSKLTSYSETDDSFVNINMNEIINEYNDIEYVKTYIKEFVSKIESGDIDTNLFDKIFVILSLRVQALYSNFQYSGQLCNYYSEEMYSIPNTFCINVLKLGLVTCFNTYANTLEAKEIMILFKDLFEYYDVYKDDLIKENTSKYLLEHIMDLIYFKIDEITLASDSIYSKITKNITLVNTVLNIIYNESIREKDI
jgi:hypothetical protein